MEVFLVFYPQKTLIYAKIYLQQQQNPYPTAHRHWRPARRDFAKEKFVTSPIQKENTTSISFRNACRDVGKAIADFGMIEEGDRIMCACRRKTVTPCWKFCAICKKVHR